VAKDSDASDYRVTVTKSAQRDLKRLKKALNKDIFAAIDAAILGLGADPRRPGYEALKGQSGAFRCRVGDYRILYGIDDAAKLVRIAAVGDRKEIYKH